MTDMTGIAGIYLSESMMSSTAYSAVYIRTNDEGDAKEIFAYAASISASIKTTYTGSPHA